MKKLIILLLLVGATAATLYAFRLDPNIPHANIPSVVIQQEYVEEPKTISIPKIGVHADIESLGKDSEDKMLSPVEWDNAGWYNLGYRPGENGSAVIAGHLDTRYGGEAVFYNLSTLRKGDTIVVSNNKGKTYTFIVESIQVYDVDTFPLEKIFNTRGEVRLNLITCSGDFVNGSYTNRLVVYSRAI